MSINYLSPDFGDIPGCRSYPRGYARSGSACAQIDVSIVTPYYNTEAFFSETFDSIRAQTLQNWEWLIVDDGSTDQDAVSRLVDLAKTDERVRVIHQSNAGPAAARNTSFRNSVGRYVCLLDSDDLLEPTYLEKCVWFLDSNPEYAFCNAYTVAFGEQQFLWTQGFERGKAHLQTNIGPVFSVIRRVAYADCGGFDESIHVGHEDWDFWLAMANAGHWGHTIPEFLQWYRKKGNGRFEQVMSDASVNEKFESAMHRKYKALESRFPAPTRRLSTPFQPIETEPLACNPLLENPAGRRIMFIIPWMVTGGADRVNLDLVEGVAASGHDVTICATLAADHVWEHEFSRFTADIFVLPNFLHESDYPRFLVYLIRSRCIDTVVITGSTLGYQLLPYLRAYAPQVAFLDMCHVEEPHWQNGGHPRFAVGYQDVLDLNITTTNNLGQWMQARGADRERIRTLYTGVRSVQSSAEEQRRVRTELGIAPDVPLIVFAGRMCEQKRPAMLADILKGVRDAGSEFRALVIGDGELKQQFARLLDEYRLDDRVAMLDSVGHRRWLEIIAASDILLMPSKYEGISIALLEALASGCVPVVAKVGGQDEIVSPGSGVLIPHGENELQEYVAAVHRLLNQPSTLRQMSEQCQALAGSKLSWGSMIQNFLGILDEAHERRVREPRNPITPNFGRELAVQALECKRVAESADWLWNARTQYTHTDAQMVTATLEAQAAARLAIVLSQTWLGRKLVRSPLLQSLGRFAIKRLGNSKTA